MRRSQPTQTYVLSKNQSHFGLGLLVMMLSIFLLSSTILNANNSHYTDNLESNFETTSEDLTNCQSISFKDYHVVAPTCGNSDGVISFRVNNPNNYCLVYRLWNYDTGGWATGFQTSRVFSGLPVAQYRVKMYVDHNCNVNNPNTDCYTPSAYQTLTCTTCAPQLTINNTGTDPARLLWWKNTGDEDVTVIQPGSSYTLTARDNAMFRVINTNTDWNNLLYDEHETVNGCSNQSWNIAPNYSGNGSSNNTDCSSTPSSISGFVYLGEHNGSKYFCSETNKTWSQAKSLVQSHGGHVAVINDSNENTFLKNNVQAEVAWIGYTDAGSEGSFHWYNGDNATYNNWNSGEPNDQDPVQTSGADNTVIQPSTGKWLDRNAANAYEVIMEIPCGTSTTTCTGDISSIVVTNGTQSVTLQNGGTYNSCDLPLNGYLEAVVSGNHESFKFTVDGHDRTENAEAYNYPAASNGETWNPQVGVHNITGTLYSQDGLGGDVCDQITIQIIIESCQTTGTCENFTNGGVINSNQTICSGNSVTLQNVELPSGGSGAMEYVWLGNTAGPYTDDPTVYQVNDASFTTGAITQTTWFRRCGRRTGCTEYDGESNWIKVTVDNTGCNTTCNGNINQIVFTNGSQSVSLQNGATYNSCDLPVNGYLEAVVSGNHESFKFTVDGHDRTENAEAYNYPAASNGETWNPSVGSHTINGKLYSENNLGGTLCDEINITINVTACTPANIIKTCNLLDHGISDNLPNEERLLWLDIDGQGVKEYAVTGSSTIVEYSDGSAVVTGTAEQVDNNCNKWEYNVRLINKRTWSQWSAMGRSYKSGGTGDHTTWEYYELDNYNSIFTGKNCLSGKTLNLTHNPGSYEFGFQIGNGANDKDSDFGFSGWYNFTGSYTGHGDFNGDVNCGGTTTCTGDISSIILTNGTESITLQDGGTYELCNLPVGNYLEAIVSGNHESFKYTVDGFDRTENSEAYHYPAVSNGETWNPGVGVHNIAGTLYSENGLGGDICDQINIQITITTCAPSTGTIGDKVFEDTNGNGIQDAGEPGVNGVTVMLLDAAGNMVGQTTTTGGGLYGFGEVPAGDYKIKFTTPNGYDFTNPNKGNDDTKDSDATPMAGTNDGMTEVFTVNGGDVISNIDAGIYEPVKLGNKVFEDTNGNGIQDTNEPGIDGVVITLLNFEGNNVGTTTTANGGLYEFTGLIPGDYKIQFPQTATTNNGVTADLTSPNQGGDDTKDSDAVPMAGSTNAMSQVVFIASGNENQTIDAGYIPGVASIGNIVFEDLNGNGIQDANELGIDGVTVMLLDANGDMISGVPAQTTSNGGQYDFTNIAPGTYKVKFTAPTQNGVTAQITEVNQGTDDTKDSDAVQMPNSTNAMTELITVNAGDDNNNVDAGYFFPAKLGDKVFEDTNGNGIQDNNEPGIDGVTVMLIDGSGSIAGTTTTTNGGLYEFTGLAPDDYKVKFPQSATTNSNEFADLTQPNQGTDDTKDSDATPILGTTDAESQVVTIESGDELTTIDAGYVPAKVSIGDIVFEDKNGNGIQDNNEPGIDGVTVMLLDANGNMIAGVPAQTTSGGGEYSFTNLPAGTYKVKFTAPTQNGVTAQITDVNQGTDESKDSDAVAMPNSNDAMTEPITVNAGDDNNDVDAGYYFPAKIGNYVWADKNNNGIQEVDEPAFDGVTVMLLDANGNMISSTTTANGGFYEFAELTPGDYQVKFPTQATTPGGVIADLVAPDQGGDDTKDSDATPIAGTTDAVSPIITLQSGDNNETIDAGYYDEKIPPASIGNIVFEDLNANGIQDANEPGIDDVTVMLLDANGNMIPGFPAQTTANGGQYDFTGIAPGIYKVKFTAPTQNGVTALITEVNQGNDDTKDSDAVGMPNSNDAMTAPITVTGGENIDDVDAGYYFLASLGNYVWEDTNLNGIQDFGEAGIPGVPVELRDGNGNPTGQSTTTDNDGLYSFRALTPGDYKVIFPTATTVNNANLILTASDLGGNDAADSDAVAMAVVNEAMSPVITLNSGDNNDSIDAGYFETATIGDRAFNDQNQNGLQDNGDANLPGVTVMLIGTDAFGNEVNQTLVTDNDGEYLFTNVVPGTYELKFTTPTTLVITEKDTQGNGFDFGDSDIDPLTGKTAPFTVTSGDDNRDFDAGFFLDPALPVALTSFEAQLVNNSEVILKWATASEEDNSHFIVERSADGRDFEAIGTVAGNGTTNQVNKYSLVDKDPYYGYNYYRLKQVDFDGDYEFSQIETVIISSQDVPDVIIYPNPVMTTTTLRVVTPFETDAQVEIVDQTGKVVLNVTMAKGANSKQLDMSKFAAGMYFAYVNYNGHRQLVHKIVKVEE